jgi:hypothetical protein
MKNGSTTFLWVHVKFTAIKEYCSPVVVEVP